MATATKTTSKTAEKLTPRRGWMMNSWERWLAHFFMDDPGPVTQAELIDSMTPFVKEFDGPEDVGSVIRNNIRRLVRERWIIRKKRGHFIRGPRMDTLKEMKVELGKVLTRERNSRGLTRQDVATFLGHRTKGRYATLEQGRTNMHVWEIYALEQAFEIDLVAAAGEA